MSISDTSLPSENCSIDISTYASLTIHGLGSSEENPAKITLSRSQSFPAPRLIRRYVAVPRNESWAPLSLPNCGAQLELELTDKISEGRVGLAYGARVINNTAADLSLPDLCIKLVKPKYGRTLAREAWFYEQLARQPGYEGVVTPRCFGFFTVSLKDCLDVKGRPVSRIMPWENIKFGPLRQDSDSTDIQDEDRDGWLPDDPPGLEKYFKDEDDWKSGSSWDKWRSSSSDPLICILVLERLGKHYSCKTIRGGEKQSKRQEVELDDMRDLVRDLCAIGISQSDLRTPNIVRATSDVICPRHKRAHRWRVIDFDIAAKVHVSPETARDIKYVGLEVEVIGGPYFWGWL
ncbi:hypothetical protein BDN70DRAFT_891768 [Pholiota conissans]|uniref:Protein kinase domain-containing protein n=1 Tax=Pholiota conissans TaxID=109636 RepID=A0A9P5ZBB8_9AGAR|nr:hypothetical protein BDN70DRAFT_891768 [Pholiota conissans]